MNGTKINKSLIYKIICVTLLSFLLTFLSGYLITSFINQENSYYQVNFVYEGDKDLENIISKEYLQSIKDNHEKYNGINVDKLIDNNHFKLTHDDDNYTIITKTKYYEDFFFASKQSVGTRAKTFIRDALTTYVEDEVIIFENPSDIVELKNHFSPYLGGTIGLGFGAILSVIFISLIRNKNEENIEDNISLFKTPFHKEYWKGSLSVFKDTKKMVTLAMLFALLLVSKLFSLPSGFGNLGIGLAYIFLAIIGLIYGPIVSLIIGVLSDILGYFITPQQGVFYLGYTIQACLASVTYAFCFYKTKLSFSKVLLSRLIVNLLLNVALGSLLQCRIFVLSGTTTNETFFATFKAYALLYSLPKNLIYLLPQSIVLYLILKGVVPILTRFKYLDERIKDHMGLI